MAPVDRDNRTASRGVQPEQHRCPRGAVQGLCSCRLVFRGATLVPVNSHTSTSLHSGESQTGRKRFLAVTRVEGDRLDVRLFDPRQEGVGIDRAASTRVAPGRRCMNVSIAWSDWWEQGYGPLQWMSHAQKRFMAELVLSRVYVTCDSAGSSGSMAFLRHRPVIASVSRPIALPGWMIDGAGVNDITSVAESDNCHHVAVRKVVARDQGHTLHVEVLDADRKQSLAAKTFDEECWRGTGLGPLLWLDQRTRRYLAWRLVHQARNGTNHVPPFCPLAKLLSAVFAIRTTKSNCTKVRVLQSQMHNFSCGHNLT